MSNEDKWYISGPLGIGTTPLSEKLEVAGNIVVNAPDSNIYSLQFARTDESGREHKWALWHMNSQYRKNALEIWEYKTDSTGKNCDGNPADGAMCTPRLMILEGGNVGIGTTNPGKKLHIEGSSSAPLLNDGYDRPGLAITGSYPELDLFSAADNPNHGPTIRMGGYNDNHKDTFKQWVIGTAGRNSTFLDIGFSDKSDPNPHAGIRDHNGKTCLTILDSGNVGIGTTDPKAKLDVKGNIAITAYPGGSLMIGGTDNAWSVIKAEPGILTINEGKWAKVVIPSGDVFINNLGIGALKIGARGTVFSAVQAGTATLGSSNGVTTGVSFPVKFPSEFASTPRVVVTVRGESGQAHPDVFLVSVKAISTSNFIVNVARITADATITAMTSWGQQLQLDWFAWEGSDDPGSVISASPASPRPPVPHPPGGDEPPDGPEPPGPQHPPKPWLRPDRFDP